MIWGRGKRTCNTTQELSSKILDVVPRKRCKLVFLEEIINTHSKELRHEAYMVSMIKPMQEVYAFAVIRLLSHGIAEPND
jgi:hypothetical protein